MPGTFGVNNPLDEWKKGDMLFDPIVYVVVQAHGTLPGGSISVSTSLANDEEIDNAINSLQKELESVRKQAKRVLAKQKQKILVPLRDC